jgi:hypothetical protein
MKYKKINLSKYWISQDSWFKISNGSGKDGKWKVGLPDIKNGENLLLSHSGFRSRYKITGVRNLKSGIAEKAMKFQWEKIEFVDEDWGRMCFRFFISSISLCSIIHNLYI